MAVQRRTARAAGAFFVSSLLACGATRADTVESSVADYEPRFVRPTGSMPGTGFAIDTNIDTPSDAAELRIGGQARFKFTGAFFFPLPALDPGQSVANANLRFAQRPDASVLAPNYNADLRILGITQDISDANDPDATGKMPTVGPSLSSTDILYSESDTDTRPGIGTALGRLEIQDNFVTPADTIATGGATTPRETNAAADTLLTGYINSLIAQGIPAGSYLIVTLNPDGTPNDEQSNRYLFASSNSTIPADHPTLSYDVVPEPGGIAVLGLGALGLIARRRRR
jgi:PEP-CTERM motif